MKRFKKESLNRIAFWATISSLILSVVSEILKDIVPPLSNQPTKVMHIISSWQNICLLFLALSFTVLLFLLIKKRLGIFKAIFFTIFADSFIAFSIGILLMAVTNAVSTAGDSASNLTSLYLFLLGLTTSVISASVFLVALTVFIISIIILRFSKKNTDI